MSVPALEAHGIRKSFKKKRNQNVTALEDVSLTISEGEVVGLLGPNGSGKSTLVRVFSTLFEPDQGSVSRLWDRCGEEPTPGPAHDEPCQCRGQLLQEALGL